MAIDGSGSAGQVTYWVDADTVTGSDDLFWDTTNKRLGIGTSNPDDKIHVVAPQGTYAVLKFQGDRANLGLEMRQSTGHALVVHKIGDANKWGTGLRENADYVIRNYSVDRNVLTIKPSTSYFGINTSDPANQLHVVAAGSAIPQASANDVALFQKNANQVDSAFIRVVSGASGSAALRFGDSDSPDAGYVAFSNGADTMELSATKVGIGLSSPNEKLEVAGNVRANGVFNVNGTAGISTAISIVDRNGTTHNLTFTGGILTSYTTA